MPDQEFVVTWVKNYYIIGTRTVMASSKEEAELKMMNKLGDMGFDDGKLCLDDDNPGFTEVC